MGGTVRRPQQLRSRDGAVHQLSARSSRRRPARRKRLCHPSGSFRHALAGDVGRRAEPIRRQDEHFVNYAPDPHDPHKLRAAASSPFTRTGPERCGWERGMDCTGTTGENETFTRYTESQGLPSSDIHGHSRRSERQALAQHQEGDIPVRSADGDDSGTTTSPTACRAMSSARVVMRKARSGEMFFGGSNGINAFLSGRHPRQSLRAAGSASPASRSSTGPFPSAPSRYSRRRSHTSSP